MEYQHLVFEEFARKVQPRRPAVPRLQPGHQPGDQGGVRARGLPLRALDAGRHRGPHERRTAADNSVPLLTAFLNPPEFFNGGAAGTLTPGAGGRQRRHGLLRPGRQRARRVRHRDAAQQPARPAARPADAEHGPGPRGGRPVAERGAAADLRRHQRRAAGAVHQLVGLRPAPQAPRVADQLRGRVRHAPEHHRRDDHAGRQAGGGAGDRRPDSRRRPTRRRSRPTPRDFMFGTGAWANTARAV